MYPFEKHKGEDGEIKGGKYIVEFYWEMLNNASALFLSFLPLSPSFLSFDFFLSSLSSFPPYQKDNWEGSKVYF